MFMQILEATKAKWNIEGERSTRYFCNLEKRHYTEKNIPKLILEDNTEVTHQKDILVQQQLFYQTLYESRGTIFTDEHLKSLFDDINPYISKLKQDKKLDLHVEGELTPQETLSALKLMKNGKSPGMDGFTTEFYKFFWKDINPFLVRSFNHGYEKGQLSVTQRQGVITCLPKEGKPKFI